MDRHVLVIKRFLAPEDPEDVTYRVALCMTK